VLGTTSVSLGAFVGILAGVVTCLIGFATVGRWMLGRIRSWVVEVARPMTAQGSRIEAQVTPNGGYDQSLGTRVVKLERQVNHLQTAVNGIRAELRRRDEAAED
jgi:hypothetical protein